MTTRVKIGAKVKFAQDLKISKFYFIHNFPWIVFKHHNNILELVGHHTVIKPG